MRHAAFVAVNAETSTRTPADRSADVPNPVHAALALADIPINRNSAMSLAQARSVMDAWRAEVRAAHARGDVEVFDEGAQFHLIEVSLDAAADAAERERLLAISTNLELSPDDLVALRALARAALARSPDFRARLGALSAADAVDAPTRGRAAP